MYRNILTGIVTFEGMEVVATAANWGSRTRGSLGNCSLMETLIPHRIFVIVPRDGPTPDYLISYTGPGKCFVRIRSGAVSNTSIAVCTTVAAGGNMNTSSRSRRFSSRRSIGSRIRMRVRVRSLRRVGTVCATDCRRRQWSFRGSGE
jgi:hypothetical protein